MYAVQKIVVDASNNSVVTSTSCVGINLATVDDAKAWAIKMAKQTAVKENQKAIFTVAEQAAIVE